MIGLRLFSPLERGEKKLAPIGNLLGSQSLRIETADRAFNKFIGRFLNLFFKINFGFGDPFEMKMSEKITPVRLILVRIRFIDVAERNKGESVFRSDRLEKIGDVFNTLLKLLQDRLADFA